MFTGIIQTTGTITKMQPEGDGIKFAVKPASADFLATTNVGDSISINGACMTSVIVNNDEF